MTDKKTMGHYNTAVIVASLLVLVARGDGEVSQAEIDTMIDLVAERFQLNSAAALERVKHALQEDSCDLNLPQIMRIRARQLSMEEKREILIMLLQVARADGIQRAEEVRAINIAAKLIDLPPNQVHEAYKAYFSDESHLPGSG